MRVILHASHLVVYDQNVEVARHERLIAKGAVRLDLDHYLEVLVRNGMRGSHPPTGGPPDAVGGPGWYAECALEVRCEVPYGG